MTMTRPGEFRTRNSTPERPFRTRLTYTTIVVVALTALVPLAWWVYHTRTESFELTYFPDDTYAPARNLPTVDDRGQPRVVLVRKAGQIECFDVFYSQKLMDLLRTTPNRQITAKYRVFYRFGHPFWIETLDVAGLGIEPSTSRYTVGGSYRTGDADPGECF